MKTCVECGSLLVDRAKFCPHCGRWVNVEGPHTNTPVPPARIVPPPPDPGDQTSTPPPPLPRRERTPVPPLPRRTAQPVAPPPGDTDRTSTPVAPTGRGARNPTPVPPAPRHTERPSPPVPPPPSFTEHTPPPVSPPPVLPPPSFTEHTPPASPPVSSPPVPPSQAYRDPTPPPAPPAPNYSEWTSAGPPGGRALGWPMVSPGYPEYSAARPLQQSSVKAYAPGDWSGAILTVTLGMLVAGVLMLVLMLTSDLGRAGPSRTIGFTATLVAQGFGGSVNTPGPIDDVSLGLYQMLGPAVVGFLVMGLLYVRRLRGTGISTVRGAAVQIARCLVVLLVELLLDVLLSHLGSLGIHADVLSTLGFGALTLIVVLGVAAILGLRDLRPARVERVRAAVAGPLGAVIVLYLVSMAVTFVVEIVVAANQTNPFIDASLFGRSRAVELGLGLPDFAAMALPFGLGVPVNFDLSGQLSGATGTGSSIWVTDLARFDGVYWLWPLIAVLLMLGTGYLAGRWSPVTAGGRSMAPVLGAVFPVVLLAFALLSRRTGGLGAFVPGLSVGADLNIVLSVAFGAAWGLVAGLLGMLIAGRRPVPPPELAMIGYEPPVQRFSTPDYPLVEGAEQASAQSDPFARRFGLGPPTPPPGMGPPPQWPPDRSG